MFICVYLIYITIKTIYVHKCFVYGSRGVLYSYNSDTTIFINKTLKKGVFKLNQGKNYSKLFKENCTFTCTPITSYALHRDVLIGIRKKQKSNSHNLVAYPMAARLVEVVLDNS